MTMIGQNKGLFRVGYFLANSLCLCLVIQAQSLTGWTLHPKIPLKPLLGIGSMEAQNSVGGTSLQRVGLLRAQSTMGETASCKFKDLGGRPNA